MLLINPAGLDLDGWVRLSEVSNKKAFEYA